MRLGFLDSNEQSNRVTFPTLTTVFGGVFLEQGQAGGGVKVIFPFFSKHLNPALTQSILSAPKLKAGFI